LYKFQVANENYDPVIKGILRIYGGELYSNYIKVSERKIATEVDETVTELVKKLQYLHIQGIIRYDPQKEIPQVTFLTHRYDARKLPLNKVEYLERKNRKLAKMNAMIGYINRNLCRSMIIAEYFGERKPRNCGICDICIINRQKNQEVDMFREFREIILQQLEEPLLLDQLIARANPKDLIAFSQAIREMVDQGELRYLQDGKLSATFLKL